MLQAQTVMVAWIEFVRSCHEVMPITSSFTCNYGLQVIYKLHAPSINNTAI